MTAARVFKRSLSVAFAFAALLGLASCGGGGHSAPVPPPPEPPASPPPLPTEPLRLGLINIGALDSVIHGVPLHFANEEQLENSGPTYRAALLAIRHVNDAGGVWGMPVEHSFGDVLPPGEPEAALAEELIEQGAHALVGSTSQGILAMSDLLVRTRTPLVAAFSDAPSVADLEDDGFIFRTSISALFQAYALARLAEEDGFSHVAVAYLDLAWAQESAQAFTEHFNGRVDSVSLHPEDDSFEDELHRLAASAAPALVLFTFRDLTHAVMDEVIKNNHFEEFLLFEGLRTLSLYQDYPEALEGAKGVASYGLHITEAEGHWEADYMNEFGVDEVPHAPYMRETYDAAVALMLAAESARSSDGEAIRDALHIIANPPGRRIPATSDGMASALMAIQAGEDIDLDGEASTLDWDDRGELVSHTMGVWQFRNGAIEDLRHFEVTLD